MRGVNEIGRHLLVNNVFFCYFGDVEKLNCFLENYFFAKTKLRIIFKEKSQFSISNKNVFGITCRLNYFIFFVILYYILYC